MKTMIMIIKYLDFKDIINMVYRLQDECFLNFEDDRLHISCVDTANVALINLDIPKSAFESYDMKPMKFGIELNKIKQFCDMSYGYITIEQILDKDTKSPESLKLTSGKYSLFLRRINENQIKKEPNIPNVELSASTIIKSSDIRKFFKHVADEKIQINILNGTTIFKNDNFKYTIDNGRITNGNIKSFYSGNYLKSLFRDVKGDVIIELSTDHPCKIHLNINGIDIGYYLLAPRIETD